MLITHFTLHKFTTVFLRLSILNAFQAILEPQIFKIFWGSMLPDPPRKLAPSTLGILPPNLKVTPWFIN